jgi:1-acyl-sn-glycerol-3-phosphate acyltransferase/MFS family permease
VPNARLRLLSLGLSQVARAAADWCLRVGVIVALVMQGGYQPASAWHLATVVFVAPFILLAPLNGYLSNSLPRRTVLVYSATFIAFIVALAAVQLPWDGQLLCLLGLTAFAGAIYQPARYAMLPAAAEDSRVSLPRVNGWMEMGSAAAILVGILFGWYLTTGPGIVILPSYRLELAGGLLCLNALCLATAFFALFPSDHARPEPVSHAVAGFYHDALRIGRDRAALGGLLGLASFQAIVTTGAGVLLAGYLAAGFDRAAELFQALLSVGGGAVAGCALAGWQSHPARNRGLVPFGAIGLLLALVWGLLVLSLESSLPAVPAFVLGFTGALVNAPLRSVYLAAVPADARGNATSVMNAAIYTFTSLLALFMYALAQGLSLTPPWQLGVLAGLALAGAVLAVWFLIREMLENILECLMWPVYPIRAYGPGVDRMPQRGPLLVVANHSAYVDVFWVCKVVPRPVVPMMSSLYYDVPIMRWLMVNIVRAIRVEETKFRREAPELREAIDRLHKGECLVLYPEGRLRFKEHELLRPFGQGVWHILREVPETVVVVLWIEGGWGSWSSYFNGRPMKNKRFDWWRRIDIGIGEPAALKPEVLKDHRTTREYLYSACLACRQHIGLAPTSMDGPTSADSPC